MKVYLDMDGLLVNLFDTVAVGMIGKHYKDLTKQEKNKTRQIWRDKEGAAKEYFKKYGGVEKFFIDLPSFGPQTKEIINTVVKIAGGYSICSCPASIDWKASEAGKRIWIHKHLNPLPDEMSFVKNKAVNAINRETGKPNVLIDDFPPYIQAWRNAGGIAIEMRTDSFKSPAEVKSFLIEELTKAKEQIDNTASVKESFDQLVERLFLELNSCK
jgi:hypothetical protein